MTTDSEMKKFLVGKENVDKKVFVRKEVSDSKKFFVKKEPLKRVCADCGSKLPMNYDSWKDLCKSCYMKGRFTRSNIRDVFERTGESSFANNSRKFDGVEKFWKK